jgi:heptosyltransferase-2
MTNESMTGVDAPNRVVVVTRAGLGDAVYVIPALRALRFHYPHAHIAVITGDRAYRLLKRCPYLDSIRVRGSNNSFVVRLREWWWLRTGRYDLAVILDTSDAKALHTFLAGIPRRIGGCKRYSHRFLTDSVHINPDGHQINDLNRDIVARLGCDVSNWRLELFPESKAYDTALSKMERAGWHGERPLVGLNVGTGHPTTQWLEDRFAQVADSLQAEGIRVVLLGGSGDVPKAGAVRRAMTSRPIDLTGQLDVDELIACLQHLDVLVSGDTGPAHVAAAAGTPVVGLYGATSPRHFAPVGDQHVIVDRSTVCPARCRGGTCVADLQCMRSITVQDVLGALDGLLSKGSRHSHR